MGAKIIYKKMLMQQIQRCSSDFWVQHLQFVRNNLSSGQDIGYFFKFILESLKVVVAKSANCSNWMEQLQHVQKNYFVSHLTQEDFACQNALDIKLLISEKYGYIFCLIAEFIARLLILNVFMKKNKDKQIGREKEYRNGLNSNLQKLRFQLQIENINRISEEKSVLQYQQIIQYSIHNIIGQSMDLQTICLVQEVMKQQNANIPDQLLENISQIIRTGRKLKRDRITNIQNSISQPKDLVLQYIQKRQKELQLKTKQNAQKIANLSNRSQLSSQVSYFKKEKIIQKTRTIYHQRKNVYIPRKKRQEYISRSQKSIDMSTQWSFTIERFKKTTRDINEDFEDDFLVGKTPKPQKVFNFKEPISFRLDFSN